MNDSFDQIIADLRKEANQVLEAFNRGELILIEALRKAAELDRKYSQKLTQEYLYMARGEN